MSSRLAGALLRLLACLPLNALHRLGASLGWLLWHVPNRLRDITEVNLGLCFPQRPARWRKDTTRASLIETGKSLTELAAVWYWPLERVRALLRERGGWEHFETALAHGRGVILVMSHAGAWELASQYLTAHAPVTFMYRRPRRPGVEPLLMNRRQRAGARLVPADAGGIRTLYKTLRAGQVVCVLPDQEPRRGAGVFAPFLGVQTYTMVLLSRLARRTNAPTLMLSFERLAASAGYRLCFEPLADSLYAEDPVTSASAVNQGVERVVHRHPAQYMWSYKRFRRQPDGSRRRYRL